MIRGIGRLRKMTRRLGNRFLRRAIILGYHRVAEVPLDPWFLCVTPQHFAEQLEILRKCYQPIRLKELAQALRNGDLPQRAVVVTFDDGYADNLLNAKWLLDRYDVPATVFVTTSYIGQNREFWWDELEKLLLLPEELPEKLKLNINGGIYEWSLRESREQRTLSNRWDVTMEHFPSPRHEVYKDLHRLLKPLASEKQYQMLMEIARWAGSPVDGRLGYRGLDPDELRTLSDDELVEIGSHTITHPVLSAQPPDIQLREIIHSKKYLEECIGRPVISFSYPYGGADAVGEDTIRLVHEVGYKMACASFAALVTPRSDPYWLPRYMVRDWSGEEFASRLKEWFRG